jgi:superfamily II DNA/RNA helicase
MGAMTVRESEVGCKDCGKEFVYSEYAIREAARRGESRPERCQECAARHARQTSRMGVAYIDLIPEHPLPVKGLKPSRLGRLAHPDRPHTPIETPPPVIDASEFGIKDEALLDYLPRLAEHQVSIVQAPTGSGKSTFFPYRLIEPPAGLPRDMFTRHGRVIVTQPRIEATTGIPEFVADRLHGASRGPGAGVDIGYRHSKANRTDRRNRLIYLTDGTLLNMIRRGELHDVGVVIIDEAHERSLNIDLIIALMRRELQALPHLKLIIASATIDATLFTDYFEPDFDVLCVEFEGKALHPVLEVFNAHEIAQEGQLAAAMPNEVAERAFTILQWMSGGEPPPGVADGTDAHPGDILAFLPGKQAIKDAIGALEDMVETDQALRRAVEILPLHAELPESQRRRALGRKGRRKGTRWRVVMSTNLAETSLTVEGVRHVIDSGLINMTEWDPATITQIIRPQLHSQAGLRQRRGRAGRVATGVWHCLLTTNQFEHLEPSTPPEIVRAPLEALALTAASVGVPDPAALRWLPPGPPADEMGRSVAALRSVAAVDRDGDPTSFGHELSAAREPFHHANLLLRSDQAGCAVEAATVLAALAKRDGGAPRGAAALLRWNRGWPATTKLAVDRVHQAMLLGCVDDLDVICTVIAGWEATPPTDRATWAARRFVDAAVVAALLKERERLMSPLLSRTKSDALRSLDRTLLDRLRAVVGWTMATHAYSLGDDAAYVPHGEGAEADSLHAGASVELDPRSRCSLTQPPLIAVLDRRRRRRWISPLQDPIDVVEVALACAIEPRHLRADDVPLLVHLHGARRHEKTAWWFPDVLPGERYDADARDETPGEVPLMRSLGRITIADATWGPGDDDDEDNDTGDLSQTMSGAGAAPADDEPGDYIADDEDDTPPTATQQPAVARSSATPRARLSPRATPPYALPGPVVCVGLSAGGDLLVDPDDIGERTVAFAAKHAAGGAVGRSRVDLLVVRVARFQNDARLLVELADPETGLIIPCGSEALGVSCRDAALSELRPGSTIHGLDVDWIDRDKRLVVLSRTTASAAALSALSNPPGLHDATIVDAFHDSVYLRVDAVDPYVLLRVKAHRLPSRPREMEIGQRVRVRVKPSKSRPRGEPLPELSDSAVRVLSAVPGVEVDGDLLVSSEAGSLKTRQMLRAAAARVQDEPELPALLGAIDRLWQRAAMPLVDVIDVTGIREASSRGHATVTVGRSGTAGVDVILDGGTHAWIHRRELGWAHEAPPPPDGEQVRAFVTVADPETGELRLTLKDPSRNPYAALASGVVVSGTVTRSDERGADVTLASGAVGYLRRAEAAVPRDEPVSNVLRVGGLLSVRVLEVDAAKENLTVSRWLARATVTPSAARRAILADLTPGRMVGSLRDLTATDVTLDDATGTVTLRGTVAHQVRDGAQMVEALFTGPVGAVTLGRRIGAWLGNSAKQLRALQAEQPILAFARGSGDSSEIVLVARSEQELNAAATALYAQHLVTDVGISLIPKELLTAFNAARLARLDFVRGTPGRAELKGNQPDIAEAVAWLRAYGITVNVGSTAYDTTIPWRRLA